MHRLDCVKSSEVVSLIPSSGSSRRAKCSLETPVATVELFEVAEKKPQLLVAWPDGTSKSSTLATGVSSEHSARLLGPDDGIKKTVSELLTQSRRYM